MLHTTGGYLVFASMTHQYVFDYHDGDIYWCTADVGWVTGHSYILYGPLANGATTLMFEGVPNYPDNSRFWNVIDKHKVNIFYTAPTAIRALMQSGDEPVKKTSRKSLRLLGSVGEPINPEAWEWYHRVVGDEPLPDRRYLVADRDRRHSDHAAARRDQAQAGFGDAAVLRRGARDRRRRRQGAGRRSTGNLCIAKSWPGQMRTVYGDHARFEQTYFSTYKGKYFTGDGCRRDADGYYWITGRVDDVINVSGHRMGTAEVESSLVAHAKVSEAAVVGYPHDIKGQGIYAYVTLMAGTEPTEELRKELVAWVRKDIGPIASPDQIQFAPGLPKTRSGKIMRRILRKIAEDEPSQPRRHLDAGRSRRGRRSRAEPAEQEGRAGVSAPVAQYCDAAACPDTRGQAAGRSPASSLGGTVATARAALTRLSVAQPASAGISPPCVVFRSFTLIRTFSLFPSSKPVSGRRGNHPVNPRG